MSYSSHCFSHGLHHRVTVKRRYENLGPQMRPAADSPEIVHEALVRDGVLECENDMMIKSTMTDIVIKGTLHAPGGTAIPEMEAAVSLNGQVKRIKVTGQRYLSLKPVFAFSAPEPFVKIPFRWTEAYGGTDSANEAEGDLWDLPALGQSMGRDLSDWNMNRYKRNPVGKGFVLGIKPEHEGLPLPRIEFSDDLLTPQRIETGDPLAWFAQPSPACFGWLNRHWFPRLCFMGGKLFRQPTPVPHVPLPEYQYGFSFGDLFHQTTPVELAKHPRIFQGAHPALQLPSLSGKQDLGLFGFRPHAEWWMLRMPTEGPRIEVRVPGMKRVLDTACSLSQVVIDTDNECLDATWHGLVRASVPVVEDAVHDVQHLVQWK